MQNFVIGLAATFFKSALMAVTPKLRDRLEVFLLDFYKHSKETPNFADDILAAMLLGLFEIPTPNGNAKKK